MKLVRFLGNWVLPTLFGILFVLVGFGKMKAPGWERNFLRWGFPPGAHMVVGGIEIAGGLALIAPPLSTWAAGALGVIMVGAVGTHVFWAEPDRLFTPILYLGLLALVAYVRRHRRIGARPRASGG